MLQIGQKIQQVSGTQIIEVIGFEPELIENVITQWEDEESVIITGKFMESQLSPTDTE